ncbi:MAG: hypothetical protein ACRYGK_01635 [Janthinobacterium lividum]
MSLEEAVQEQTKMLGSIFNLLKSMSTSPTAQTMSAKDYVETIDQRKVSVEAAAKLDASMGALAEPKTTAKVEATPVAETVEKIEYPVIAKMILDLVKKDRPTAVELLAGFDAKKGQDLKPEQYTAVAAALREKLAA